MIPKSVTVADLLRLPSLRHTEVVAGSHGLNKIVSSISVLEPPETAIPADVLFSKDEFYGGEIFITAFTGGQNNMDLHCRRLRWLAEGGAVGLIVFCIGGALQEAGRPVIALADKLDFTLISMPRNYATLRYSEIIRDVMEAIFKDQASAESIVVELLERVSRLPQQQTVDAVLKMLSDRLRATLILTDTSFNVLNEAAWPRTLSGIYKQLREIRLPPPLGAPASFPAVPGGLLYRAQVQSTGIQNMELFVIREENPLESKMLQYAAETVQLAAQIWGQQHDRAAISELLRAIMQDEPLKMRRLADLFHIDIASVHMMWIISPGKPSDMANGAVLDQIRQIAAQCRRTAFADIYKGSIVLLMDGAETLSDMEDLRAELFAHLPEGFTLTMFNNLNNVANIREAFLANAECYRDARKMFPLRPYFYGEDIVFARECRYIINCGEASVEGALMAFSPLRKEREFAELKRTLAVYFLDTDFGLTETADRMFLHKNTIKYRLKRISDRLGFRVGSMPASLKLYRAVAVERLLVSEKMQ